MVQASKYFFNARICTDYVPEWGRIIVVAHFLFMRTANQRFFHRRDWSGGDNGRNLMFINIHEHTSEDSPMSARMASVRRRNNWFDKWFIPFLQKGFLFSIPLYTVGQPSHTQEHSPSTQEQARHDGRGDCPLQCREWRTTSSTVRKCSCCQMLQQWDNGKLLVPPSCSRIRLDQETRQDLPHREGRTNCPGDF